MRFMWKACDCTAKGTGPMSQQMKKKMVGEIGDNKIRAPAIKRALQCTADLSVLRKRHSSSSNLKHTVEYVAKQQSGQSRLL